MFEETINGLNVLDIGKDLLKISIYKKRDYPYDRGFMYKRGSSYVMLCPFHMERTPSCYIRDRKNLFFCYGCHARGGPLTLLTRLNESPLSYLEVKIGFNSRDEEFVDALRKAISNEKIKYGFADETYRNYFNEAIVDLE